MSDDFVTFVPVDPRYMPTPSQIKRADATASMLFPRADNVEPLQPPGIAFFHAGGNSEAIFCPQCNQSVPDQWWQRAMSEDSQDSSFRLNVLSMPCCDGAFRLNELRYEWPQAFGSFGLEVQNPNTGLITPEQLAMMESALGVSLKVVYVHL